MITKGVEIMIEPIKQKLDEEILRELENLSSMDQGTQEHTDAVDSLTKLYKMRNEDDRLTIELNEKKEDRNDKKEDRIVKIGIASAEIVLPLMFYAVWMRRGLKFEESGTFTSQTFRGLISRFKPTN